MRTQERTFKDWTIDDIRLILNFKQKKKCDFLDKWLSAQGELSEKEEWVVDTLLAKAIDYIGTWNEQELQVKFIGPITELVNFDNLDYYFSSFSERKMEATYGGFSLKGKVNWMVAVGKSNPHLPFFFIHEYKKQQGASNDPLGQLLATMIAADVLNQTPPKPTLFDQNPKRNKDLPVYGCYIVGRLWYFVVLYKKEYCVSEMFDSVNKESLTKIIAILKRQKQMIIDRLEAEK